jgi:hypothetical protein
MWLHVSCKNGHRLKIAADAMRRDNRCPICRSRVALWVQVVCPNGHELKVKSKHCGKRGRCPHCQQQVQVPDVTEAVAWIVLSQAAPDTLPVHQEPAMEGSTVTGDPTTVGDYRDCPRCGSAIHRRHRVCPACQKHAWKTGE